MRAYHDQALIDEFRSNVEELLTIQPRTIESIEWFDHVSAANMTVYGWNVSTAGLLLVHQKPGLKGRTFRPISMATVRQQGWKPDVKFYSPQYTDPSLKTRPDHRITLYWDPKVRTDADGHATVRFYASDLSRRHPFRGRSMSRRGGIFCFSGVPKTRRGGIFRFSGVPKTRQGGIFCFSGVPEACRGGAGPPADGAKVSKNPIQ